MYRKDQEGIIWSNERNSPRKPETSIIEILNNAFEDDPITSSEIDAIHCLPICGKTKPIIIRFSGRKRRDDVLECGREINKYELNRFGIDKQNKMYINENLSPYMKTLAYYCRKLRREKLTRSENGNIKIKLREND